MGIPFRKLTTTPTLSIGASSSATHDFLCSVGGNVYIQNLENELIYVKLGISGVQAATTDLPVKGLANVLLSRDAITDHYISIITGGGNSTVLATCGQGDTLGD